MNPTLLLLALAGPALAQEVPPEPSEEAPAPEAPPEPTVSPVARCADAAGGAEVEVCLQLAVEHPDEVDGIAAALRAHIAREGSDEQQLLLALLALVDDQTAPDAASRIAELGDPRALPALVACAERRQIDVARACIRSVAPFEEGLTHLDRWLTDDAQPIPLRIAAAETLGTVGTDAAADLLIDALRRPRLAPALRRAILDTIRTAYPDRAPETEGQVASDGRLWLSLGGAYGMGYAMGAAGYFGKTNLAGLGWVTGAVGGGTAGWLYGRAWPMEAGDAAHISTGAILGSSAGMFLASGASAGDPDWLYTGGLLGLAGGTAVNLATRKAHPGNGADAVEASGVAAFTSLAAGMGTDFVQRATNGEPERTWTTVTTAGGRPEIREAGASAPSIAAGIGLIGGATAGYLSAPHVDLTSVDGGLIALTSAWGLGAGALLPLRDEGDRGSLIGLTLASGTLLGYGLSAPLEVPGDVQAAAWAGGLYGGVFGAGVGLLIDPYSKAATSGALGFGTAGMVGGAVLAHLDPEPLDDRDVVLTGLATGWVSWQSAGWAAWIDSPDPTGLGWFLILPATASAGVAAATPVIDIPVPQSMAATSLGLWGAYGGGVAAELANEDVLLWSLVGSDVGLAGGALVMSPVVGASPVVIGVADAGGVLGGSVSALSAAFLTDEPDTILATSLIGAGAGFATGMAIGASWKKGGTRDMARLPVGRIPGRWGVRPDMGPERMGLALQVTEW